MKMLRTTLAVLLTLLLAVSARSDDKIASVDPASSLVTVDSSGSLKVYRSKPFTEITINGVKATLEQLRPGMTVALTLADTQTASRIAARGLATSATPADPNKPRPFFERPDQTASTRRILIKMRVDGADRITYRDGQLVIEHIKAIKPDSITVNGIDWKPTWKGDTTEPFTDFKPPLAPIGQSRVALKQMAGRAKAQMEKPASSKFERIPTVLIEDKEGGADNYEFQLSW
jgi:hypothetical protein